MNISLESCRICLGTQNLQSIFEDQPDDTPIREKIVYCASVQVSKGDSLPEMICNQCLFYLDIAYVFKTVCEATDKKLRDFQLTQKIGEFSETEYDDGQECFTCDENGDTSGQLNTSSSNVENNCEISHNIKETYSNDTTIDSGSKIIIEESEINHFIDERDIEETVLHEDFEETIKSEIKSEQNIPVLLVQDETEVEIAAEPEENAESMVSEETQINTETDKQIIVKNNIDEDELIRDIDNCLLSETGKQKHNTSEDAEYSSEKNILKDNTKDKVGRHIAKKITGKFPQKLHQNSSNITDDNQKLFENKLKDQVEVKDVYLGSKIQVESTQNFEDILENDMPMVVFEETVVTAVVVTNNETCSQHTQDIVNDLNAYDHTHIDKRKINISSSFSEKSTTGKKNEKPKIKIKLSPMTLRKGSRKVNVFDDHSKNVKAKQKKKVKDLTNKTVKAVLTNKTKDGFKCDVCSKSFPFRSHLIRHLNMHTGIKRYTCEYCKQKFINNYNLSVHMLKHTGEFPLKCDLCSKGFPNPSLLKRHMTSHTGEANFHCRYCSVKFTQSSSLRLHERMHLHRPSYHCDICYKVFSYTNSLAAHKKLHFGAKRFSCDVCLTTFSRKSSLIRHMEGHTKSRKIKCKFCDISFNSKNNYYSHLKTHCKYRCEVCGESFRYKTNLINHIKKHKGSLKCEQCYKQFQNKAQLVKHLEKHIK